MYKIILSLIVTSFTSLVFGASSLTFDNQWIRLTPPVAQNTAGYFMLSNHTESEITIVSLETSIAAKAELHDMTMENGAMGMVHMPEVAIKPHQSIEFKPAGKHLMLLGLTKPLKEDQEIEVTFNYSDGSSQTVVFPVLRKQKKMDDHHHEH